MSRRRRIRRMGLDDLDFALTLAEAEDWDNSRGDFDRLLSYEPEGCFLAEEEGRSAGMVTTSSYGPLGWIGCLIVAPGRRGGGLGAELMQQAIEYLQGKGAETIRLDAVQQAVSLYQRLGFVEEGYSLRFRGRGCSYPAEGVEPMKPIHLEDVFHLDAYTFGADRSQVLRRVFQDFPELCYVSSAGGEFLGYIMARRMLNGARIGPWVCHPNRESRSAAQSLLRAVLHATGDERVNVGALEDNRVSQEILEGHGFRESPWSWRMRLGPDRFRGEPQGIFAIGSPAKG